MLPGIEAVSRARTNVDHLARPASGRANDAALLRPRRAIGREGGYPFAAIVTNKGRTIVETTNRVSCERDVTRHAEIVAISRSAAEARLHEPRRLHALRQRRALRTCSYAIRESRISRVVFGLSSPVMGGHSRWNILEQTRALSAAMPEVFAPPPDVCSNFLSDEADAALRRASPILWAFSRSRGLFVCECALDPPQPLEEPDRRKRTSEKAMRFMRRRVFDHFGGRSGR